MTIAEIDTPAVLIDLDRLEANISRWQRHCDGHGIKNRPHIKTHKSTYVARLQMAAGAVGITCQKLGEAEVMAECGIGDIFLTYNIVGPAKLERLSALHRRISLRTIADSSEVVAGLRRMAKGSPRPLRVFVECETGLQRMGVSSPEAAADLAWDIHRSDSLIFSGFSTYPSSPAASEFIQAAAALCAKRGIAAGEISGGGTPNMWDIAPGFTEHRAGTAVYHDLMTVEAGVAQLSDCALTVLVSVVSTAGDDWVTVDGGTKTFSSDQYGLSGFGAVQEKPSCVLMRCNEEHGMLEETGRKPCYRLGDKLRIIPNHACTVSNLHDSAVLVRGENVVGGMRIEARGKLQ